MSALYLPQATLASGSILRWASRTASLIWSHILSRRQKKKKATFLFCDKNWKVIFQQDFMSSSQYVAVYGVSAKRQFQQLRSLNLSYPLFTLLLKLIRTNILLSSARTSSLPGEGTKTKPVKAFWNISFRRRCTEYPLNKTWTYVL